jgi:DNA-binding XRE family transcriptional regulator
MISPIKTDIVEKLRDKQYRSRFFRGRAQDELAYQLREARKKRKMTQSKLGKDSAMKQSAISRMEQASYPYWNFQSLLRLADAMDLRVRVILDYAEDVIGEYERHKTAREPRGYIQETLAGAVGINSATFSPYMQQGD